MTLVEKGMKEYNTCSTGGSCKMMNYVQPCTDKQNALRRECTFRIEIVLEIGVNIFLKITVLTLLDVLARLAQSVRPRQMVIDFFNK